MGLILVDRRIRTRFTSRIGAPVGQHVGMGWGGYD